MDLANPANESANPESAPCAAQSFPYPGNGPCTKWGGAMTLHVAACGYRIGRSRVPGRDAYPQFQREGEPPS
jgi:hypothetical protein